MRTFLGSSAVPDCRRRALRCTALHKKPSKFFATMESCPLDGVDQVRETVGG
ncbi:MAG: hypothetical protein ACXWWK_01390 [Gemmatimonadales bacterium]